MKDVDIRKRLALLEEFETSGKLIKLGLGELQNIGSGNDFYFLPFQLLSQGFERFMKAYICVGHYEEHKELPNFKYIKNLGHDLELLLNDIVKNYYHDFNRPQFIEDNTLITSNQEFRKLLYVISEFGKFARYHNFDLITSNNNLGINPVAAWQILEFEIINSNNISLEKTLDFDLNYEITQEVNSHIIVLFERFVSSLSRQFIFSKLGENGSQMIANSLFDFGLLYENDFGKTDYRKGTTKYKETPKKVHERSLLDDFERKFNPNYKSKIILQSEYSGDWPFYATEVIVECRYQHWCIITIEGKDYSLNGAAKGKYKLENPHDAGMAILGKSFSDFITIAREL